MKLIFMGEEILCAKAVKDVSRGTVIAYSSAGAEVFRAEKVTDFSLFRTKDGSWSQAEPSPQEDADALLVDHEFRLTLLELGIAEEV